MRMMNVIPEMTINHNVNINRGSIWANPLSAYFKIGRIAFGVTLITNICAGFMVDREIMLSMPTPYIMGILMKSVWFMFFWPAIPFKLLSNPGGYLLLGGTIRKFVNE